MAEIFKKKHGMLEIVLPTIQPRHEMLPTQRQVSSMLCAERAASVIVSTDFRKARRAVPEPNYPTAGSSVSTFNR